MSLNQFSLTRIPARLIPYNPSGMIARVTHALENIHTDVIFESQERSISLYDTSKRPTIPEFSFDWVPSARTRHGHCDGRSDGANKGLIGVAIA